MRQLPGANWLASADLMQPPTVIGDGPKFGFSSNRREMALWGFMFTTSLLTAAATALFACFFYANGSDGAGDIASSTAIVTAGIALFALTRPPWSLVLNASTSTYEMATGFRPFIRRKSGPIAEIRGIGAATVQKNGEEACVLFLVFQTSHRPLYLAWHPLPSTQVVAREAAQLGQRLNIPVITSKQVLKG